MNFLRKKDNFAETSRPDLNLPGKNGREVLAEIKSDPELRTIPVVILTSSEAEEDIVRSYSLHANCYITKPVNFDQFLTVVQSIDNFWFRTVELPPCLVEPIS